MKLNFPKLLLNFIDQISFLTSRTSSVVYFLNLNSVRRFSVLIFAKICYKKLLKCKRDFIVRLKIGRGPSRIQNKLQIIFNIKKQNPILAQNKSLMRKQNYKKHHIFYNEGNRTRYLLQPLLKLNISSSSPVLCTFFNISEIKTYILAIRKNKVFSSTWFSIISFSHFILF